MLTHSSLFLSTFLTAPKKVFGPKQKMRMFQWDKLGEAMTKATFWSGRKVDENAYKKLVDFNEFEELFLAKAPVKQAMPVGEVAPKKPEAISVLDSKRSYNCMIMLGGIKLPYPEIRLAIMAIDKSKLSENIIRQFLNYVPTPEEVRIDAFGSVTVFVI